MEIELNFGDITQHLLIQRILNNYYIITGIVFLLIGIFLCFFGFYQNIVKIIVSVIFGEIFTFIVLVILIGFSRKYLELLFIIIGLIIGVIISYFSIFYIKIYKVILGLTTGIIFGIYLTNIVIYYYISQLINSILIDNIIISTISFLIIIKVLKKYYIFLNSIIGGYILIRGLSIVLFKYLKYREMQLIIYFIKRFEWEFFENNINILEWNLSWIYDLLIFCSIFVSMIFYYLHTYYYSRSDSDIETDNDSEEQLEKNEKVEKFIINKEINKDIF